MPFNLLLLPLLGGYIFALCFNRTRYYLLRADKERLLIIASICGFALTSIVWAVNLLAAYLLPCKQDGICIPAWWRENVGIEYSGVSIAALLLGLFGGYPLNKLPWFNDSQKEIDRVLEKDCDPLELLLRDSQQKSATVSISMKNGKVYIGWVNHDFNPATETKFISIMPIESGYRIPDTKRLIRTVDYSAVLEKLKNDREQLVEKLRALSEKPEDQRDVAAEKNLLIEYEKLAIESKSFSIVLPVAEIVSINLYDRRIHTDYFLAESAVAPFVSVPITAPAKENSTTTRQTKNRRNTAKKER